MALLFFSFSAVNAQENLLNQKYKEQVIHKLSQLMNDYYVFPEVAKLTEKHLLAQLKEGHFDKFENDKTFAEALTISVQSVNKDKHMRIRVNKPYQAATNSPDRLVEELLDDIERSRETNSGLNAVKIMEGNVGYLDLREFSELESGIPTADAYMKLLSRTDAVIVDLRENGGGVPSMVQYLCSYFFDQKLLLDSHYHREGNDTIEYWTLDKIGGTKMPDVPLFVIISGKTFSGAEEFAYNMQTQKRATLVGQTSRGGANPGGTIGINEHLNVFIPTGTSINPITKTNWEGVGVVPEVVTSIEESLGKTHKLAMDAAKAYRSKAKEKHRKIFFNLSSNLEVYKEGKSEEAILKALTECRDAKLFEEGEINDLGYDYLLDHEKPKIAEAIFKSNTILYPNSPNVFDSYAEALMTNGDLESALENYQKAFDIATESGDMELEWYQKNLESIKRKLAKKN